MTKQILSFSTFLFLALAATPVAFAVDGTPTPNPTRAYIRTERQNLIKENQQNRVETREKNLELRKQMLTVTGTPRVELRDQIKENNQELKAENKANRLSFWDKLKTSIVTRIYTNAKNSLVKRYNYLVESGKKILTKLDEKSAKGTDVTAAKTKLAGSDAIVGNYNTHLAAFDTKFQEIMKSDKPWTLMNDLRAAEKLVRTDLQQLRQLQIDALKLVVNK